MKRKRLLISLVILILSASTITGNSAGEINQWSACGLWSENVRDASHRPYHAVHALRRNRKSFYGLHRISFHGLQEHGCWENWTAMNNGLDVIDVRAMAIDPLTPGTLYASTYEGGIFKSTDGGNNWTAAGSGWTTYAHTIYTIAIDPLTPSTLYAGTNSGVFKSTDAGENWTSINALGTYGYFFLAIDPLTPSTIYAGGHGVFKSTDAGDNWNKSGTYLGLVLAFVIDPLTPSTLYMGTRGGVFKSTDAGENWTPINNV